MNAFLLFVFAVASGGLVAWGLMGRHRVYQYPFLAGAVFVGWMLPQATSLVDDYSLPDGGYALTMLMAILCVAALFAGHYHRPKPMRAFAWQFSQHRLLAAALFLSLFGSIFNFSLGGLSDELLRPESGGWTGRPTILLFFALVQNYGFAIAALHYAKTRSPIALAICIYDLAWFFGIIVLSARRTFTIEIILIILLSAWFGRRWIVKRWMAGVGVALATLAITSIGYYRAFTGAAYGGVRGRLPTWEEVTSIDFVGNFQKVMEAGAYKKELYTGAFNIAATQLSGAFNLGASYWNDLVFSYVPAQILGADFKNSMMFDIPNSALQMFGFVAILGNTHTGLSDSFMAFWFFGALVFYIIARIMRTLYVSAMNGHIIAQLAYMMMISDGLLAITHHSALYFSHWVHFAIFMLPVLAWARVRPQRRLAPIRHGSRQRLFSRLETGQTAFGDRSWRHRHFRPD